MPVRNSRNGNGMTLDETFRLTLRLDETIAENGRDVHYLDRQTDASSVFFTGWSSGFSRSRPSKPGTPTRQAKLDESLGIAERHVIPPMWRVVFNLKHLPVRLAAGWPELLEPRRVEVRPLAIKKDLLARGRGYRNGVRNDAMGQFD